VNFGLGALGAEHTPLQNFTMNRAESFYIEAIVQVQLYFTQVWEIKIVKLFNLRTLEAEYLNN